MQSKLRRAAFLFLVGGAFIAAACAHHASPVPARAQAAVISHGDPTRMEVALTFDTSNEPGGTSKILDTLMAKGVKATFGVTGRWVENTPDLVRRVVNEGHSLINHTYWHHSFTGKATHTQALTQAERWNELDATEAMVQKVTGATTKPYFRAPYGDYDASVNADVYARGYLYNVSWSVDSLGWKGIDSQAIVQRCLSLAKPGAIYLFHVGIASQDYAALPAIIDGLRSMGYGFVTVPELISRSPG